MFEHKHAPQSLPISTPLAERWSPYGLSDKHITEEDILALFEAARWAPSSYNEQPWRFILSRNTPASGTHDKALACLLESNQVWAANAPLLVFGCTVGTLAQSGKPNKAAQHDLGLAVANLTFEAQARGLSVHQIIGIVPDLVRALYALPETVEPLTAFAIGYAQTHANLPEHLKARDASPRTRRPLAETVFSDTWGNPALL